MNIENAFEVLMSGGGRCPRAIMLIAKGIDTEGEYEPCQSDLVELAMLCLSSKHGEEYAFEETSRIVRAVAYALGDNRSGMWLQTIFHKRHDRIRGASAEARTRTPPNFFMPDVSSSYGVVLGLLQLASRLTTTDLVGYLGQVLNFPIWGTSGFDQLNFRDSAEAEEFVKQLRKSIKDYVQTAKGDQSWHAVGAEASNEWLTSRREAIQDLISMYEDVDTIDPLSRHICEQLATSMLWTMSAEDRVHVLVHGM